MEEKTLNFEQAMCRLDELVKLLERGDAPLEESLKLFEEGTALISLCNDLLNKAEQQVVKLSKGPDGAPVEHEFDAE